jgi:hypothetical protein
VGVCRHFKQQLEAGGSKQATMAPTHTTANSSGSHTESLSKVSSSCFIAQFWACVLLCRTSSGPAVLVNNAQITLANIPAGKAIVHLVRPLVAPAEYEDVLDALIGFSAASMTPTTLWQSPASTAAVGASDAAGAVSAGQDAAAMESAAFGSSGQVDGMQAAYADGSSQPASASSSSSNSGSGGGSASVVYAAEDDDAAVQYSFEQDFSVAEQAATSASAANSAANAAGLLAESGQQGNSTPTPATRNGVQGRTLGWWGSLLGALLMLVMMWAA